LVIGCSVPQEHCIDVVGWNEEREGGDGDAYPCLDQRWKSLLDDGEVANPLKVVVADDQHDGRPEGDSDVGQVNRIEAMQYHRCC